MDVPQDPDPRDRSAKAEHTRPIPDADRRRKVRKDDTDATAPAVITDWASI
ncbi:MAG: hypothetical protein QNJ44_08515 [Rhodobacter sp.]|nr:hypothetical protein [Rhodobacter sp.]